MKKEKAIGFEFPNSIGLDDFINHLTYIRDNNKDKGFVVVLRQTEGTDFPPTIVVENEAYAKQCESEGFIKVN